MKTTKYDGMKKAFSECVGDYMLRHRLPLDDGRRVLVALSGGADSVALLRVLLNLGVECHAVHCNFGLRGEESERDERFVRRLCQELGVALDVLRFDTRAYAAGHKVSIEMAARELRYAAFERLRVERGLDDIAVAHHAEDSVETILINLMRGTGIDGLTGIQPRNGHIVRPLLGVTRADIEEYLRSIGQDFVNDSSNDSDDYTRNRVRHHLVPLMQEINPSALAGILTTASNLQGVNDVLHREATDAAAVTVLHDVLHPYGYNTTQVSNLLDALRHRKQTLIPSPTAGVRYELVARVVPYDAATMPRTAGVLCLDVRRLTAPLTLRRWQEGDRFCPFGMGGRKKLVSDVLTDSHLSRVEREAQPVLCVGDDIAWVVGIRSDERFRVPSDAQEILLIEKKLSPST